MKKMATPAWMAFAYDKARLKSPGFDLYINEEADITEIIVTPRDGTEATADRCFECCDTWRENGYVYYDEVNRMAYCKHCKKEIADEHDRAAAAALGIAL